MELQQIVERYAEAIEHVDATGILLGANSRTGEVYLPGFKSLNEAPAVQAIDEAWEHLHPGERQDHRLDIRYPFLEATAKCDHVLTTDGQLSQAEWGIEVKRIQFVGDNGKRNDYAATKILSPYFKDRGLLHDAARLREYGFTRRIAVIGISYDYDLSYEQEARSRHQGTRESEVITNVISAMNANGGTLHPRPLIEFADAILGLRGFSAGPRAQATFEAWRHPAGGNGVVFGWEIRRPQLEPDYDPRHPW